MKPGKSVFHFPGAETLRFIIGLVGRAKISRVVVKHVPIKSKSGSSKKPKYGAKSIKFELK